MAGPTAAQIKAGNYKKGHIVVSGLDITIENPVGSRRKPHYPPLKSHYGYIRRTKGADGDHVDIFVREGISADYGGPVFIVDQLTAEGYFDEHKVLLGWPDEDEATAAYLENYTAGWKIGPIHSMSLDEFKTWLEIDDTTEAIQKAAPDTAIKHAVMPHVASLQANLHRHLQTIAKQIAQRLAKKGRFQKASKTNKARVEALLAEIARADWEIIDDELNPELKGAFSRAGYKEADAAGAELDLKMVDQAAVEYADARAAELVTEITETTRDQLRSLVTDALEESWSTGELTDAVEDAFSFSEYRAGLIARTELAQAHTHGRIKVAEEAGSKGKQSLLSLDHDDGATCSCEEAADAGVVDMDDLFVDGDADYDFPPYHPNCWCDWVGVYEGEGEGEESDDGEDEA